ncbi:MAG: signal peptidase II [Actinobacteria bacterium]|nr:signal peptidase II [Actinomycetota bacterium]
MTEGEPSASERTRSLLPLTLLIAAAVVVVDQLTKHWAVSNLAGAAPRHVIWTLQWNLSFNSGMAFSRGQGMGVVIGLIALVVVVVIIGAVRTNTDRLVAVAAGLVAGGALGNVVDRLFRGDGLMRGAVIDFIDFQWFPIFNVADMAVNVGGALFIIWSLFGARKATA